MGGGQPLFGRSPKKSSAGGGFPKIKSFFFMTSHVSQVIMPEVCLEEFNGTIGDWGHQGSLEREMVGSHHGQVSSTINIDLQANQYFR